MVEQEAREDAWCETEVADALLPALGWRAEALACSPTRSATAKLPAAGGRLFDDRYAAVRDALGAFADLRAGGRDALERADAAAQRAAGAPAALASAALVPRRARA